MPVKVSITTFAIIGNWKHSAIKTTERSMCSMVTLFASNLAGGASFIQAYAVRVSYDETSVLNRTALLVQSAEQCHWSIGSTAHRAARPRCRHRSDSLC